MKQLTIPGMMLLPKFRVELKGFFNNTVFIMETPARNRSQAMQIVSAIYFDCYKRAEITEIQ